jgi:hypothetical protein
MSKTIAAGLSALFITASSLAYAQVSTGPAQGSGPTQAGPAQERLSDADLKAFTDRRIEVLKFALQLKPDQEKYWPAVEEAIRARAMARHQRLVNLASRLSGQREVGPVELLRDRADALATRAANLKKLADAWQPLYASLDDNQKARLRLLAVYVLREMRDAVESRRLQAEAEDYDESEE